MIDCVMKWSMIKFVYMNFKKSSYRCSESIMRLWILPLLLKKNNCPGRISVSSKLKAIPTQRRHEKLWFTLIIK